MSECDFREDGARLVCIRCHQTTKFVAGLRPEQHHAICRVAGPQSKVPAPTKPLRAAAVEGSEPCCGKPGLVLMGWNYALAVSKWVKAGSPVRSQARIDEILAVCKTCPMYATTGGRDHCRVCGCSLNAAPDGLQNKIAMATESCPLTPPKWTAEV